MQKQIVCSISIVALALVSARSSCAQASAPWLGTWKLNLEKSHYNPGPPPKSTVTKIEPFDDGRGLKYTVDTVRADGESRHIEWSGNFGRKDNPVAGDPYVDTIAVRRIDGHTFETIAKKNGRVTMITSNVISSDGKIRTATAIVKDAQIVQGESKNVAVFDKQ